MHLGKLAVVCAVVLAACSSATEPTTLTASTTSTSEDTDGTLQARLIGEWELVQAESEAFTPDVERGFITATFTHTEMTGQESCAPYFAEYQPDGSKLGITHWETTAQDCGDWTNDSVFVRFPTEPLTFSFEGSRLVLTNTRWTFVFERIGP